ncbi:DNA-binding transcriptional regulator, MarR family [Nitrosovibrio tenuis]|uniref:DNA-binding transcriptional regulator, MarR family n=1 Tax=Nitrosovibrio tenuis TaxID=1233 RepID=A0A1H7RWB8_9PROT|nr:DNA-binding transcriptional regulator, MarR family [Nitrosovibrio tenuis]
MLITLNIITTALESFKSFTKEPDVQIQTVETFLIVATQDSPGMTEMARQIGLTQPSVSRNLRKMCEPPKGQGGYGLISVTADPRDRRKRVLKLTSRGHELVRHIEEAVCRVLAPTLFKEGVIPPTA